MNDVKSAVVKSLETKHLSALRGWFGSVASKELVACEAQARALSVEARTERLRVDPLKDLPLERMAVFEQMVWLTRSADIAVQTEINVAVAIHEGASSVQAIQPPLTGDAIRRALEARRTQNLLRITELVMRSNALVYAAVSTENLNAFVDFLKSDAARHLQQIIHQALEAAMLEAATEFGRQLPGTLDRANA